MPSFFVKKPFNHTTFASKEKADSMPKSRALSLYVVAHLVSPFVLAESPKGDLTGVYESKSATLVVAQGTAETTFFFSGAFSQGSSVGTCSCSYQSTSPSGSAMGLTGSDKATLKVAEDALVLMNPEASCCGAGAPEQSKFLRKAVKPLSVCRVTAKKSGFFGDANGGNVKRAFVVSGDAVEASLADEANDYVPARFVGAKRSTAGFLKRSDLACDAGSTAVQPANDVLTGLAGKYLVLTQLKKKWVILLPCASEQPGFEVDAKKRTLRIDFGQETVVLKILEATKEVAAGAYVLKVQQETGGDPSEMRLTVDDKGLVHAQSQSYYSSEVLAAPAAKRKSFPQVSEANCE